MGSTGSTGPSYIGVRETARRLGVHENTVRNWAKQGRILVSARQPGSRQLRFDEAEVERLRASRGAVVSPVGEERRTIGPELIDAGELNAWAATPQAADLFPELMRRLLAGTEGVTDIAVRAGGGVSAPGWDGVARSSGTSFLPPGRLCFEFGVGAKPRQKAESDYLKRREHPVGLDPVEFTYVFATPRRWSTASAWATEKRADAVFSDVRVLDADNLEGWLAQTPAVHQWISEQLGRRPQDAQTLEFWWRRFSERTEPALPSALFLAGRDEDGDRLAEFLLGAPGLLTVKAPWREDALAFCAATIERLRAEGKSSQPPLLVSSADVWHRVCGQAGKMTLLPLFDGADIAAATDGGHHVVLALGWEPTVFGDHIDLPRPDRAAATAALEAVGLDSDRAYPLSAQARRSMPAFVRSLSRDPQFARPGWSMPPDAAILAPLVLLGSWTGSTQDTAAVSAIAGTPWAEVERILQRWRATEDPPFARPATQWHLASGEQAYLILREALTAADLHVWNRLASEVLGEVDPRAQLVGEDRIISGLTERPQLHSGVLRSGIAQGAALLGNGGDSPLADGATGPEHARALVAAVLGSANEAADVELWASLSPQLPLLAEAAPEAFLDAVHADLDRDQPLLAAIFQDDDRSSALFGSSPHTGLLWALEVLCWWPEHLPDAARALSRLHRVDPGGRLSNRPLASLAAVLVGWIRQTSASVQLKVEVLEAIRGESPQTAWELVMGLWPSNHAVSSPPSAPRFRDWLPESRSVSIAEWVGYIGHLIDMAMAIAASDAGRWAELATRLGPLPPAERERLLGGLEHFVAAADLEPEARLALWEAIDGEATRHGRYPQADWSMTEEPLARLRGLAEHLEPHDDVGRFAYLFDWRPNIPGPDEDFRTHTERLAGIRREAVSETLAAESLAGLRMLAERSKVPSQIGFTLGTLERDDLTAELLGWLDSEVPALREVAGNWAGYKLRHDGTWLREALDRPEVAGTERRIALALVAEPSAETWDILGELAPELLDRYWAEVGGWGIQSPDTERAASELLAHERPWVAVDLLAAALQGPEAEKDLVGVGLVEAVLDAALRVDLEQSASQSPGYEVGLLIDRLEELERPLQELARYEFAFFTLLEDYRRPRALFPAMGADPAVFVELVRRAYRGRDEPRRQLDPDEQDRARHAWAVLEGWKELPGSREDGTIDTAGLGDWVRVARLQLAESDRADIGDEQIGRALSASPEGADGIWPAEPVRELIEAIGSTSMETGLHVGLVNSRGFTSRGVYDGGAQERELAAKYRDWSRRTAAKWPRSSRVLRLLTESYERDARENDARAELSADTQ
jgi:excisionase family DNA binding protein